MAAFTDKIKKFADGFLNKKGSGEVSPFDSDPSLFESGPPPFARGPPAAPEGAPADNSGSPFGSGPASTPFGPSNTPSGASPFGASGSPAGGQPDFVSSSSDSSVSREALQEINNQIEEYSEKARALEARISKVDVNISMVQKENQDVKATVEKIDQSVLELLSLYEIVSNQVNPFVGDEQGGKATLERFDRSEKRISELADFSMMLKNELESINQKMEITGSSPETEMQLKDIDSKIDVFADSLISLQENVNELSIRVNEISEHAEMLDRNILDLAQTTSNISGRMDEFEKNKSQRQEPISSTPERSLVATAVNESRTGDTDNTDRDQTNISGPQYNKDDLNKGPMVRLETIKKSPMSVVVLLNWIEFLMERVGRNNLMDALDYYVDIGWISEDVRSEIMAYARGIDYYVEKPTWRLLPEDHTKSLLFIEKLCGRKIDRNMLSMIDREMAKVKHGLEELYGI